MVAPQLCVGLVLVRRPSQPECEGVCLVNGSDNNDMLYNRGCVRLLSFLLPTPSMPVRKYHELITCLLSGYNFCRCSSKPCFTYYPQVVQL